MHGAAIDPKCFLIELAISRNKAITGVFQWLQRDELLEQISLLASEDALAIWAHKALPIKNTLTPEDSQAVELAYLTHAGRLSNHNGALNLSDLDSGHRSLPEKNHHSETPDYAVPTTKHTRKRSKTIGAH